MRGLLVKDFRLLRQRTHFFAVLVILAVFLGITQYETTFVISYLTLVTALFTISSISYDEYDNCYCFLLTLPIDRKIYTREKYLFGLILGLSAWLLGALIHWGALVYHGQQARLSGNFMEALIYIPIFFIMISLILPFQLKYGAERGRLALLVVAGILAGAIWIANRLAAATGLPVGKLVSAFSGIGDREILLGCFLGAAVVAWVSYRISVGIMEKKEL